MANVYNTFEFIGNLSIAKETEKFKPHILNKYDSKWVKETLKVNVRANNSSELVIIEDGYFDKSDYSVDKETTGSKDSSGVYQKGSKLNIAWKDRNNKTILDKLAYNSKFVLDLSNNKERYPIINKIKEIDTELSKLNKKENLSQDEKTNKENLENAKKIEQDRLQKLSDKKHEYISRVDMIQDLIKILNTEEGANTVFKVTGNINYSRGWKDKNVIYRNFEVKNIEKAVDGEKLKLNGMIDLFFNENSLVEDNFEDTHKYIINGWTKSYDSSLKQQIFFPIKVVADGSKLDHNNEKHMKRLNGLVKPFRVEDDSIYELQYEVKFANGSEKTEITMKDLTDFQRDLIEDGIVTFEEIKMELGGNKFGDRVTETRLFNINFRDFKSGAEKTPLSLEDLVPEVDETEGELEEVDNNTSSDLEEDIDDLI